MPFDRDWATQLATNDKDLDYNKCKFEDLNQSVEEQGLQHAARGLPFEIE